MTDFSYRTGNNDYAPLHWAVMHHNVAMVVALCNKGADPNVVAKNGVTPLMLALDNEDVDPKLIASLCGRGVSIDEILLQNSLEKNWEKVKQVLHNDARTHEVLCSKLLFEAIKQNRHDMVSFLLAKGATLNYQFENTVPLLFAVNNGCWDCLAEMLNWQNISADTSGLSNTLVIAVAKQQWVIASRILALKPALNSKWQDQFVAQWAVIHNNLKFLEDYLKAGGNANLTSHSYSKSALQLAIEARSEHVVRLLCQFAAEIKGIIEEFAKNKKWDELKFLVEHDPRDNSQHINDNLYAIACANEREILFYLLSRIKGFNAESAILTAERYRNWTAMKILVDVDPLNHSKILTNFLETAIDNNQPEMVRYLLEHGANPDVEISKKRALAYASSNGKWQCVAAFIEYTFLNPTTSHLGCALLDAAEQRQWKIAYEMLKLRPELNWKYTSNGHTAAHYAISNNQIDFLKALLDAGMAVNFAYEDKHSLLEHAEASKNQQAIEMLIARGANHHQTLLRAAKNKKWHELMDLIAKYYDKSPNQNETEADKIIILGKLLHVAVEQKNTEEFATLLLLGAAPLQKSVTDDSLLVTIIKHQAWYSFEGFLNEQLQANLFSQEDIGKALIEAVKLKAKLAIVEKLAACVKDINNVVDAATGNNLVHLAVIADNLEYLDAFHRLGVNPQAVNKAKQLPITILLALSKENKLKNAKGLSLKLSNTAEWVIAQQFENENENIISGDVEKSRNLSIKRLEQRYPKVNVDQCLEEYTAFVNSLAEAKYGDVKKDALYRTSESETKPLVALVWMGINDNNALPEEALMYKNDPKLLQPYIELRKLALAEKLHQAKQMNSCVRGTRTKIVEALHHAHPDVLICRDNDQIKGEIRDVIVPTMKRLSPILFARLTVKEQRQVAKEVIFSDDQPKFYVALSQAILDELRPQFGELISHDELNKLITSGVELAIDLPEPFSSFSKTVDRANNLVKKFATEGAALDQALQYISEQAQHIFDDREDRSLVEDMQLLEKTCADYSDKKSLSALADLSFITDSLKINLKDDVSMPNKNSLG